MTKTWFKAAGIRALKTFAQTAIATVGTSAIISEVNWVVVASASLLAGPFSKLRLRPSSPLLAFSLHLCGLLFLCRHRQERISQQ